MDAVRGPGPGAPEGAGSDHLLLETHVTYHQEVRERDPLHFTTQLLDFDAKRIHYIHQMYHGESGYLAATNEVMSLHVSRRRGAAPPMAPEILERLGRIRAAHELLPRPPQVVGRDGAGGEADDGVARRGGGQVLET